MYMEEFYMPFQSTVSSPLHRKKKYIQFLVLISKTSYKNDQITEVSFYAIPIWDARYIKSNSDMWLVGRWQQKIALINFHYYIT